ncbi:hypothetical protein [Parageobacillus galactosidasius]|jgi:hypothetical protein|uniref:Uncharacterized protein n=1 Tax=Parageobacillus galactosidasius TaxID=883812 RepID=A0A226QS05_9BACL|nr:hypothetical protein [Parageobacillus galactosidasius]OXB94688.1 hypothetical protein B9L23_07420 [Parageobacillus galactosidasius]
MNYKYLSDLHVSFDHLRKRLGLPEEVEIVRAHVDDITGSIHFILQSQEEVKHITFPTRRGEVPRKIRLNERDDNHDGGIKVKLPIW